MTTLAYSTALPRHTAALLIVCCLAMCPSVARSQRLDDASSSRRMLPRSALLAASSPTVWSSHGPAAPVVMRGPTGSVRARRALIGALIGAGAGTAYAYLRIQGVRNHDNDYVAYLVFVPVGTVLGAVGGALWPTTGAR